jgi:hypothetical protein
VEVESTVDFPAKIAVVINLFTCRYGRWYLQSLLHCVTAALLLFEKTSEVTHLTIDQILGCFSRLH